MAVSHPKDIRKVSPVKVDWRYNWRAFILVGVDIIGLALAWQVALFINRTFFNPPVPQLDWGEFLHTPLLFWLFAVVTVVTFIGHGFYQWEQEHNFVKQAQCLSNIYLLALIVGYFYDPDIDAPRSLFLPAWLGSITAVIALRLIASLILDELKVGQKVASVFLIAPPDRQSYLTEVITKRRGCQVLGWLPASCAHRADTVDRILAVGVREVVAEGLPDTQLASQLYWELRKAGITLRLLPSSLMMLHRRGTAEIYAGLPTIRIDPQPFAGWEYLAKRTIDHLGALMGLIVLSPLFLVIAIGIMTTSPGGVFYGQDRVGLHGKVFKMWKFRTMYQGADRQLPQLEKQIGTDKDQLFRMAQDPRITPIGHFLRRTSLDELPQLINVLLGQMSLVGPRPFSLSDVAKFQSWHLTRHVVIPGMTGLWQVSGRSAVTNLDEVAQLDLFYIDQWCLNLDIELLLETVHLILFGNRRYVQEAR
jgi:exopolysaccharide biosynthesis polyprenyl glycosylphosphotransferase